MKLPQSSTEHNFPLPPKKKTNPNQNPSNLKKTNKTKSPSGLRLIKKILIPFKLFKSIKRPRYSGDGLSKEEFWEKKKKTNQTIKTDVKHFQVCGSLIWQPNSTIVYHVRENTAKVWFINSRLPNTHFERRDLQELRGETGVKEGGKKKSLQITRDKRCLLLLTPKIRVEIERR